MSYIFLLAFELSSSTSHPHHPPFFICSSRTLLNSSISPTYLAKPYSDSLMSQLICLHSSTAQFTSSLTLDTLKSTKTSTFSTIMSNCSSSLQFLNLKSVNNFMLDLSCILKFGTNPRLRRLLIGGVNEPQLLQQLSWKDNATDDDDSTQQKHNVTILSLSTKLPSKNKSRETFTQFFTQFSANARKPLTHLSLSQDGTDSRNNSNMLSSPTTIGITTFTPMTKVICNNNFSSLLHLKIEIKDRSAPWHIGVRYLAKLPNLKILSLAGLDYLDMYEGMLLFVGEEFLKADNFEDENDLTSSSSTSSEEENEVVQPNHFPSLKQLS